MNADAPSAAGIAAFRGFLFSDVRGFTGQQVDVTILESALAACGGLAGQDASVFLIGNESWGGTPGERFRLVALQVGEATVTILLSIDWEQTRSVQELEDLLAIGQRFVGSMEFSGAAP